jgi:hypothetical protein
MTGDAPYTNEAAIEEEEAERRAELEDDRERAEAARGRVGVCVLSTCFLLKMY